VYVVYVVFFSDDRPLLPPQVGYGRSIPLAVKLMVKHAGHIVMLSGLTLSLCFLGLVFFPIDFLRTIGIGAAITLCVCIVVNLTLVPSLLLAFPAFFSQFALPAWMLACCGCLCNTGAVGGARNSLLAGASSLNDSADDETDVDAPLSTPRKGSSGRQSFSAGSSVSASPAPGAGALSYGSMVVGVMPASAATPGASLLSSTSHLRQLHDPQQQQRSNQVLN
jgi:hypothetical protein